MAEHNMKSLKSFKKDLKRHFLKAILFIILYFAVTIVGSLIFFYIEHCYDVTLPKTDELTQNYFNLCQMVETMLGHSNHTREKAGNSSNATWIKTSLDTCERNKLERQLSVPTCDLNKLTFYKWVEYTHTICYTIGYGVIVTYSQTGRLATMLFAIPAIGITMTMNIFIGNIFVDIAKILLVLFHVKILKQDSVYYLSMKVFCCQTFLAVILCVFYGFLSQKLFFQGQITLIDGIYYSFVTFSTIGFGDVYVNKTTSTAIPYEILTLMLTFLVGMGVVASALSGLSDLFTENPKNKPSKIPKSGNIISRKFITWLR